ncbi:MAG: hypothetical protein Q9196_000799 [Gyalolechia fulgens]
MPHSRKELRKISKALRRSECGSNLSTRSSSFSPAKDSKHSIMPLVSASAEDDAYQFKLSEKWQHSIARSLGEAFANAVVQKRSIASDRGERISNGAATVASTKPRHRLLDDRTSDPFVDGDRLLTLEGKGAISKLESTPAHSEASVEDDLDKVSASSTFSSQTSVKDMANQCQPPVSKFWRSASANSSAHSPNAFLERLRSSKPSPTLPTNGSRPGKGGQEPLPEQQAILLGIHSPHLCLQTNPKDVPSASIDLPDVRSETYPLESLGGTKERPSRIMLIDDDSKDIDQGSRTKRWIEQAKQHGSSDPYAVTPLNFAAKSTAKPIGLPPRPVRCTTSTIEVEGSDNIVAASEVQSKATTPPEQPRPMDGVLADMGRLLTGPSVFGGMSQTLIGHPRGPPWGYHPRDRYPCFNNPAPDPTPRERIACDRMQDTTPAVYHDFAGPQRRQHDPITVPMRLAQRRGLMPPNPAHRYEPAFFETPTEASRRLRYPDWTQDARGRVGIATLPKEDERSRLMNVYTRRFYGGQLDAARDLHHVERSKKVLDLGGLLS